MRKQQLETSLAAASVISWAYVNTTLYQNQDSNCKYLEGFVHASTNIRLGSLQRVLPEKQETDAAKSWKWPFKKSRGCRAMIHTRTGFPRTPYGPQRCGIVQASSSRCTSTRRGALAPRQRLESLRPQQPPLPPLPPKTPPRLPPETRVPGGDGDSGGGGSGEAF